MRSATGIGSIALAAGYVAAAGTDRVERLRQLERAIADLDDVVVVSYVDRILGRSSEVPGDGRPRHRAVDIGQWSDIADRLISVS